VFAFKQSSRSTRGKKGLPRESKKQRHGQIQEGESEDEMDMRDSQATSITEEVKAHADLNEIQQLWSDFTGKEISIRGRKETMDQTRDRWNQSLRPSLMVSGIVHSFPSLDTLVRDRPDAKLLPDRVYDRVKSRHTYRGYARMATRLLKSVRRTRVFTSAEFFYSDLDREW